MAAVNVESGVARPAKKRMTLEEFLALPDDGLERWLVRGEVWEWPMTIRNRTHSRVSARVTYLLSDWLEKQPQPRGEVLVGEAGCLLSRDPELIVGIDVVYLSPEMAAQEPTDTTLFEGAPPLVVEVLSPNDTVEAIEDKTDLYMVAEVPLVWIVNPRGRTVTVHRPGEEPELFNVKHELSGEPHLPGLKLRVESIFTR